MKITEVRIRPVSQDKLKAYASVTFDGCFLVTDIKIIEGPKGLFLSMPSKKKKDGKFRDIAHPLNTEFRKLMEETVIAKYKEIVSSQENKANTKEGQ